MITTTVKTVTLCNVKLPQRKNLNLKKNSLQLVLEIGLNKISIIL